MAISGFIIAWVTRFVLPFKRKASPHLKSCCRKVHVGEEKSEGETVRMDHISSVFLQIASTGMESNKQAMTVLGLRGT